VSIISAVQGIRDEIASRLNEIESDNFDIYTNWINLCFKDLSYSYPNAPWLQTSADRTLSSGTRIYPALLTNVERVNTVTLPSTATKLQFFSPEEFDILNASASQGGNPTYYTIRGLANTGWFEFYPVPGSSITLHFDYQIQSDSVSAGSATLPNIPPKYYDLFIFYGEKLGLRRQKRYDISKSVDEDYQKLKQMFWEDMIRQTSQMPRVKSVREFRYGGSQLPLDPIANQFFGNSF
jgi:hypothetical protein